MNIYGYLTQSFHSTKDVRCVSNLGVLILAYAKGVACNYEDCSPLGSSHSQCVLGSISAILVRSIYIYIYIYIYNLVANFCHLATKKFECNSYTKDFVRKKAPKLVDFKEFLKLPYSDNRFHQVAKIQQNS
jgi:hypothetical protein